MNGPSQQPEEKACSPAACRCQPAAAVVLADLGEGETRSFLGLAFIDAAEYKIFLKVPTWILSLAAK